MSVSRGSIGGGYAAETLHTRLCAGGVRVTSPITDPPPPFTVYDVLDYLASGMSEDEILEDFPELTREDIRACLAFAADGERRLMSIPA